MSLQLTTAGAPGCGGQPLPGFSLGQQEDLAVLITCLLLFYSLHLLTVPLSAIKGNHFPLIFTEIEMARPCTKCCQRGIWAVPQLTRRQRNSSICERFSSQASFKKAASGIEQFGVGCPERLSRTPRFPCRGVGWSALDWSLPAHVPGHRSSV